MQRVQLQTINPVERSARRSYLVGSSTTQFSQKKSPCREFSYKETTMQRVQLQTNRPVEGSARRSYHVQNSAAKKPPCRQFSCKQIILQKGQLEEVTLQRVQLLTSGPVETSARKNYLVDSSATNNSPCREISQKDSP